MYVNGASADDDRRTHVGFSNGNKSLFIIWACIVEELWTNNNNVKSSCSHELVISIFSPLPCSDRSNLSRLAHWLWRISKFRVVGVVRRRRRSWPPTFPLFHQFEWLMPAPVGLIIDMHGLKMTWSKIIIKPAIVAWFRCIHGIEQN